MGNVLHGDRDVAVDFSDDLNFSVVRNLNLNYSVDWLLNDLLNHLGLRNLNSTLDRNVFVLNNLVLKER